MSPEEKAELRRIWQEIETALESDDDVQVRRLIGVMMGSAKTGKKVEAARMVAQRRRGTELSADVKAKLKAAQKARRERERQEKEAAGLVTVATPKRPRGRPRKTQETQQP